MLSTAWTQKLLPSKRSKSYSAATTFVSGDIRTVGMAGATVGLADTFIASLSSPSGLAMTLKSADSNFATNQIHDSYLQDFQEAITIQNFGVALNAYPWGFGLGYVRPYAEGQVYSLTGYDPHWVQVSIHEYHLSLARTVFKDRLALGGSLVLGESSQDLSLVNSKASTHCASRAYGGVLGLSYQFPHRMILGMSYTLPMEYTGDSYPQSSPQWPGFFQNIKKPAQLGLGLAWIPNRLLRGNFTLLWIGSTPMSALLRDETMSVGEFSTLQPRLGFAYQWLDFKNFQGTLFLGSYLETSRIQKVAMRFHQTLGLEMKLWVFNLGWGLDNAPHYRNAIASLGLDVFKILEKIDLIPTPKPPHHRGFLPYPTFNSEEHLPRALMRNWTPEKATLNPIEIGLQLPEKIKKETQEVQQAIKDLLSQPQTNPIKKSKNRNQPTPHPQTQHSASPFPQH